MHRRRGAHAILALDLLDLPGSISLAWVYKTSARKVDKHPTLNTAPARSVIKKRGPSPGPWARSRARPGPARTSYLHRSTRPAWVYKSSMERREKKEERRKKKKAETERRKEKEETERRNE